MQNDPQTDPQMPRVTDQMVMQALLAWQASSQKTHETHEQARSLEDTIRNIDQFAERGGRIVVYASTLEVATYLAERLSISEVDAAMLAAGAICAKGPPVVVRGYLWGLLERRRADVNVRKTLLELKRGVILVELLDHQDKLRRSYKSDLSCFTERSIGRSEFPIARKPSGKTWIAFLQHQDEQELALAPLASAEQRLDRSARGLLQRLERTHRITMVDEDAPQDEQEPAAGTVTVRRLPGLHALMIGGAESVGAGLPGDGVAAVVPGDAVAFYLPPRDSWQLQSGAGGGGQDGRDAPNWHREMVGAPEANEQFRGKEVFIGFIDTGVDPSHREFDGMKITFKAFGPSSSYHQRAYDPNGHGTSVAALALGQTVGVAPGASLVMAKVRAILVEDNKWVVNIAALVEALYWLISWKRPDGRIGVDVINISICGPPDGPSADNMINTIKRVTNDPRSAVKAIIAAIGNDGPKTWGSPGNSADVVGVGAVDKHGDLWKQSGGHDVQGSVTKPNVVAPGVAVRSAATGGEYRLFTGTSGSAPIAAGMAALYIEQGRGRTGPVRIHEELCARAQKPGWNGGDGRIGLVHW